METMQQPCRGYRALFDCHVPPGVIKARHRWQLALDGVVISSTHDRLLRGCQQTA